MEPSAKLRALKESQTAVREAKKLFHQKKGAKGQCVDAGAEEASDSTTWLGNQRLTEEVEGSVYQNRCRRDRRIGGGVSRRGGWLADQLCGPARSCRGRQIVRVRRLAS